MSKHRNLGILHDCSELRKLIAEKPELPIVVLAGDEANGGDYQYAYCSQVKCEIGEILDCELPFGDGRVFYDHDEFKEELGDFLCDLSDEEFERELEKYEPCWKMVIEVWVNN